MYAPLFYLARQFSTARRRFQQDGGYARDYNQNNVWNCISIIYIGPCADRHMYARELTRTKSPLTHLSDRKSTRNNMFA